MRFLTKRLEVLKIVDPNPQQEGKVFFGAWVQVENDDGDLSIFRLVGPDEFEPSKKWISIDSPVARALIGKRVDDEVSVQTPNGIANYCVVDIRYRPFDEE